MTVLFDCRVRVGHWNNIHITAHDSDGAVAFRSEADDYLAQRENEQVLRAE